MLKTIRKNSVTLALFAALATGLTAMVHNVTRPVINSQRRIQLKVLLDEVLPPSFYNNDLQDECYVVTDDLTHQPHPFWLARRDGRPVAVAMETTAPDGYAGAIRLLVGADFSGNVLGVRVTEHHETPGLGDKIDTRISNWITTFSGRHVFGQNDGHFAVKKDGGDIDQFTGATITPRAVVNATKRVALQAGKLPQSLATLPQCGVNDE